MIMPFKDTDPLHLREELKDLLIALRGLGVVTAKDLDLTIKTETLTIAKKRVAEYCSSPVVSGLDIADEQLNLAFFTTVNVLAQDPKATVLFIDSQCSFSTHRLSELYLLGDTFAEARNDQSLDQILQRIRLIKCHTADEFLESLESLQRSLLEPLNSFYQKPEAHYCGFYWSTVFSHRRTTRIARILPNNAFRADA
ncbi:hypothetical protein BC829DRAFT_412612 [Chytridium lagenaria]|nr:hypothetical protein BC829DRAFT_412612 [Chytridium lagenaria]